MLARFATCFFATLRCWDTNAVAWKWFCLASLGLSISSFDVCVSVSCTFVDTRERVSDLSLVKINWAEARTRFFMESYLESMIVLRWR